MKLPLLHTGERIEVRPLPLTALENANIPAGHAIVSDGNRGWTTALAGGGGATYTLATRTQDGLLRQLPPVGVVTLASLPFPRAGREMTAASNTFGSDTYTITPIGTTIQPAWQAFNFDALTTANSAVWSGTTGGAEIELPHAARVTGYEIAVPNNADNWQNAPRSWTIEGWNGTAWVVLDTRLNVPAWSAGESRSYSFVNPTNYARYRWNVSDAYTTGSTPILETFPRTGAVMTGSTTVIGGQSYIATGKSNSSTAWQAFNLVTNPWFVGASANEWVQLQFPVSRVFTEVSIRFPSGMPLAHGVQALQISGSHNGTAFTPLFSTTGLTWLSNELKTFSFANTTAYAYIRIEGQTGGFGVVFGDVRITYNIAPPAIFTLSRMTLTGINQTAPAPEHRWLRATADGGQWEEISFSREGGNVTGTIESGKFTLTAPVYTHPTFTPQSVVPSISGSTLIVPTVERNTEGHVTTTPTSIMLPTTTTGGVTSLNGQGGAVLLLGGIGTNVTVVGGGQIRIDATGGVTSFNNRTGAIELVNGTNTNVVNVSGNIFRIDALGGVSTFNGATGAVQLVSGINTTVVNLGTGIYRVDATFPPASGVASVTSLHPTLLSVSPVTGVGNVTLSLNGQTSSVGSSISANILSIPRYTFQHGILTAVGTDNVFIPTMGGGGGLVGNSGNGLTVTPTSVSLSLSSTSSAGAMPQLSGNPSTFLNGLGQWVVPSGGGGGGGAVNQVTSGTPSVISVTPSTGNVVISATGINANQSASLVGSVLSIPRYTFQHGILSNIGTDAFILPSGGGGGGGLVGNSGNGLMVTTNSVTMNLASNTSAGAMPQLLGDPSLFLNSQGQWASVSASGGVNLQNAGAGAGLVVSPGLSTTHSLKSIVAGSNVSINQFGSWITINATGSGGSYTHPTYTPYSIFPSISGNTLTVPFFQTDSIGSITVAGLTPITLPSGGGGGGGGSYTHPTFFPITSFTASLVGNTLSFELPVINIEGHTTGKQPFSFTLPSGGGGGGVTSFNGATGAVQLVSGTNTTVVPMGGNVFRVDASGSSYTHPTYTPYSVMPSISGTTLNVPFFQTDAIGSVTTAGLTAITLPSGGGGGYTHPTFPPISFNASISGNNLNIDLPFVDAQGHTVSKTPVTLTLPSNVTSFNGATGAVQLVSGTNTTVVPMGGNVFRVDASGSSYTHPTYDEGEFSASISTVSSTSLVVLTVESPLVDSLGHVWGKHFSQLTIPPDVNFYSWPGRYALFNFISDVRIQPNPAYNPNDSTSYPRLLIFEKSVAQFQRWTVRGHTGNPMYDPDSIWGFDRTLFLTDIAIPIP